MRRRSLPYKALAANATSCWLLAASGAIAQTIIVDNGGPGFATTGGGWAELTSPNWVGAGAPGPVALENRVSSSGTDTATWTPDLPAAGMYDVHAWWVPSIGFVEDAPYTIHHAQGTATLAINQKNGRPGWHFLGRYPFEAGTAGRVELSDGVAESSFSRVAADAVRFERVTPPAEAGAPTVPDMPTRNGGCASGCAQETLFGALEPGDVDYYLISDLPESFGSAGVLYSTRPVLPQQPDESLTLEARTQQNLGFTAIDGDFELFIFHINPGGGSTPKRMVLLAENTGSESVTVAPEQVIVTDGIIGNVHEMESNLGRLFLAGEYDATEDLPASITIPPGQTAVVAYSKRFPTSGNDRDKSQNTNCFGLVRGRLSGANPQLQLHLVAIDANNTPTPASPPYVNVAQALTDAVALLDVGASSNENMDLNRPPFSCELRRSCGVFPRETWRAYTYTVDLGAPFRGATFTMGMDDRRSQDCPEQSQTSGALLHPYFVHPEDIGNYHKDYRLRFQVMNTGDQPREFDLEFGNASAAIGLVYQIAIGETPPTDEQVDAQPVQTEWAGPNQPAPFASFLAEPLVLGPGELREVAVRFQILGNSSTPFAVRIPDRNGPRFDLLSLEPGSVDVGEQAEFEVLASESLSGATPAASVQGNGTILAASNFPHYTFRYTPNGEESERRADITITATDAEGNSGATVFSGVLTLLGVAEDAFDGWLMR